MNIFFGKVFTLQVCETNTSKYDCYCWNRNNICNRDILWSDGGVYVHNLTMGSVAVVVVGVFVVACRIQNDMHKKMFKGMKLSTEI